MNNLVKNQIVGDGDVLEPQFVYAFLKALFLAALLIQGTSLH